ncbi:MAG: B12-binding domain-containing radical SAM protein [Candidatus Schekmanbacteria bacterium]|nr:B12-binding domain-containing radical SAM protein [Candidatus Schekmanbacteria bacterium]
MQRFHFVVPMARRYSPNFSTNRIAGLVTAHAGPAILAEQLRRRGMAVRVFDEHVAPADLNLIAQADMVGVSVSTLEAVQGYRLARAIRDRGVPVVMGGVHASLNADECLDHADFVVRNEGEETLPELIAALETRTRPLTEIRGLRFWDGSRKVHNPARPFLQDLDEVPLPNWRLVEGLGHPLRSPVNLLMYFTQISRGCNMACNFCSVTRAFGQSYRHRSVDHVLAELHSAPRWTHGHLFFVDDSLMCDSDFMKEVLERMVREHIHFPLGWHSQMRIDAARDRELLDLMRRTNCLAVTCGIESVNPETLKALRKGQSVRQVRDAVAAFHAHGIAVIGFFVFGSDHDDVTSIHAALEFAKEARIELAGFMPLTPFPGTPLHHELSAQGRIFTRDWELYDVEHVVFRPLRMTPYELYTQTMECYRRFYRPSEAWKKVAWILRQRGFRPWEVPVTVLATLFWPVLKRANLAKEELWGRDYRKLLWQVSEGTAAERHRAEDALGNLSSRNLWWHDLGTYRPVKRLWRRALERAGIWP